MNWFEILNTSKCNFMDNYTRITGHRWYWWRTWVCKLGIHHPHPFKGDRYCSYCDRKQ